MANPSLLQPSGLPAQHLKILIHGSGLTILRKDRQPQQAQAWTGWWVLANRWPCGRCLLPGLFFRRRDREKLVVKVISFWYLLLVLIRILKSNEIFLLGQELDYLRSLITINLLLQRPDFQLHISSEILIWRLSYSVSQWYNYTIAHFSFICFSYLFNYGSGTWLWILLICKVFLPRDLQIKVNEMPFVCMCVCVSFKSWNS